MKPHIYLLRGGWACAMPFGGWAIWPIGRGFTPKDAFRDWQIQTAFYRNNGRLPCAPR